MLKMQMLTLHDSAFNEKKSDFRSKVTNYPLTNGDILLFEALRGKLVDVTIDLICAQSNVTHRNAIGWTALLTAISIPNNMECIVILIAAGATLSDVDFQRVKAFKHIGDQLLCLLQCVVVGKSGAPSRAASQQQRQTQMELIAKRRTKMPPQPPSSTLQSTQQRRTSEPISLSTSNQTRPSTQSSMQRSGQRSRARQMTSSHGSTAPNCEISESILLGKIAFKRIQSINKRNMYDRLHCAVKVAFELTSDAQSAGDGEWNELLYQEMCFGSGSDYHLMKKLQRNVRREDTFDGELTESESSQENASAVSEQSEVGARRNSQHVGDATLFPRLKLYPMHRVPAGKRFDTGLGTERERRGVKVIASTFNRLKYIENATQTQEEPLFNQRLSL